MLTSQEMANGGVAPSNVSPEEHMVSNSLYDVPTGSVMSKNVAYGGVNIEMEGASDPEDNTYEIVDAESAGARGCITNPTYGKLDGADTEIGESLDKSMAQDIVKSSEPLMSGYSKLQKSTPGVVSPTGVTAPMRKGPGGIQRGGHYDIPSSNKNDRYSHLKYN